MHVHHVSHGSTRPLNRSVDMTFAVKSGSPVIRTCPSRFPVEMLIGGSEVDDVPNNIADG
jgi:hypothetical protein